MLKRRYVTDSIMQEYHKKKKYEQKREMQEFQRKNCLYCKNKNTDKCHITRNVGGNLNCVFNEM